MKKSKKVVSLALLTLILTIGLHVSAFGYSLIIENDYLQIFCMQGPFVGQSLALNVNKGFDPSLATVNYAPDPNPKNAKVIFAIKDLLNLKKKQGVKKSSIKVGKKNLKITYLYELKSAENHKAKKKKKLKDKIKNKITKIKNFIWGKPGDDIYVKILSAKLNGVELPKFQK